MSQHASKRPNASQGAGQGDPKHPKPNLNVPAAPAPAPAPAAVVPPAAVAAEQPAVAAAAVWGGKGSSLSELDGMGAVVRKTNVSADAWRYVRVVTSSHPKAIYIHYIHVHVHVCM